MIYFNACVRQETGFSDRIQSLFCHLDTSSDTIPGREPAPSTSVAKELSTSTIAIGRHPRYPDTMKAYLIAAALKFLWLLCILHHRRIL